VPIRRASERAKEEEPTMPRMIFVNLPAADLDKATAFYTALGFEQNPSSAMRRRPAWSGPTPST
jgi:hypothetical protein